MAKPALEIKITTSGLFFTPRAIGSVHRSIYDDLREVAEVGASAAANVLTPGHGVLPYAHSVWVGRPHRYYDVEAGALQKSIEPRLVKAGRYSVFTGRAFVVQGARGFEPVRVYGGKINQLYRHMYRGAAAATAYASAHGISWGSRMAGWLSKAA